MSQDFNALCARMVVEFPFAEFAEQVSHFFQSRLQAGLFTRPLSSHLVAHQQRITPDTQGCGLRPYLKFLHTVQHSFQGSNERVILGLIVGCLVPKRPLQDLSRVAWPVQCEAAVALPGVSATASVENNAYRVFRCLVLRGCGYRLCAFLLICGASRDVGRCQAVEGPRPGAGRLAWADSVWGVRPRPDAWFVRGPCEALTGRCAEGPDPRVDAQLR